jgi:hypothetical protein
MRKEFGFKELRVKLMEIQLWTALRRMENEK